MHSLSGHFYILYCLAIALCRWVYQNNSTYRKVYILCAALALMNALFLRGLNMSEEMLTVFYVLKLIACDLANAAPETKNCINPVPQIVQISSFNKIPIVYFFFNKTHSLVTMNGRIQEVFQKIDCCFRFAF